MNSSKFQQLSVGFSVVLSVYFLIWGIPSKITNLDKYVLSKKSADNFENVATVETEQTKPAVSNEVIRVKSSGDDPFPEDQELAEYTEARDHFAERFGFPYDQAKSESKLVNYEFAVPEGLEDSVNFWVHVFGHYKKDQFLIHHVDDVQAVYAAVDLSDLLPSESGLSEAEYNSLKKQYLREEKANVSKYLKNLSKKVTNKESLTPHEQQLAKVFKENNDIKLEDAFKPENIRLQGGFAHRFRKAIEISGLYMDEMEKIFSLNDLPIELTRLPFVESAFNILAQSSANAAGLWQFIPETGKRYLKIDSLVDERLDPILATYAAAEHLKREHDLLGSWPLAINSYNTGPGRMLKAQRQFGDDIAKIIKEFTAPGYKFYSRNYFPEFLAAVHVYENQEQYFGIIEKKAPLRYDMFSPSNPVNLKELSYAVNVSPEVLSHLNPAISKKVLNGSVALPNNGYLIRVPQKLGNLFASAAKSQFRELQEVKWHIAKYGETLSKIAQYYQIPVEVLEEYNDYLPQEPILEGTAIELPRTQGMALNPGDNESSRL